MTTTPNLNNLEKYLQEKILPDLEKSRGGFDKIHTLEVAGWLKQIISHNPKLKLDKTVLLIAAYAHDWGYSKIFKAGQIMNIENRHAYIKMLVEGRPVKPFDIECMPPPARNPANVDEMKERSYELYGRDRVDVEMEISRKYNGGSEQ